MPLVDFFEIFKQLLQNFLKILTHPNINLQYTVFVLTISKVLTNLIKQYYSSNIYIYSEVSEFMKGMLPGNIFINDGLLL